jgi:hypothetical protein
MTVAEVKAILGPASNSLTTTNRFAKVVYPPPPPPIFSNWRWLPPEILLRFDAAGRVERVDLEPGDVEWVRPKGEPPPGAAEVLRRLWHRWF